MCKIDDHLTIFLVPFNGMFFFWKADWGVPCVNKGPCFSSIKCPSSAHKGHRSSTREAEGSDHEACTQADGQQGTEGERPRAWRQRGSKEGPREGAQPPLQLVLGKGSQMLLAFLCSCKSVSSFTTMAQNSSAQRGRQGTPEIEKRTWK